MTYWRCVIPHPVCVADDETPPTLPRRGARLVQPPRTVVAAVDYDGGGVLHRDAGGRLGALRQAGDIQHRPGLAVHWPNLHRRARRQWHSHQHGRQRRLARHVFVERLWRSVKYEEVYLRAYDSVSEARASIGRYFDVGQRFRSGLFSEQLVLIYTSLPHPRVTSMNAANGGRFL